MFAKNMIAMFKKNPLIQYAGLPITSADIRLCFPNLASPQKKIQALEKSGEIIRLKRNLYIVNSELGGKATDPCLCANHLYGPSYISVQWAMRYYGMIPERVYLMTSITTKRSREFRTPLGTFSYMHVPASYFPIGVKSIEEDSVGFLIAGREKALCDTILYDSFVPHKSVKALYIYLEEDMRLDMDILYELDTDIIQKCAETGPKSQIFTNLIKIIKR